MTYALSLGSTQSGIIVRGEESLRVSAILFDARRDAGRAEEQHLRNLLRAVIAIRKAGAQK